MINHLINTESKYESDLKSNSKNSPSNKTSKSITNEKKMFQNIQEGDIMQKLNKLELMADEYLSRNNKELEQKILDGLNEIKVTKAL